MLTTNRTNAAAANRMSDESIYNIIPEVYVPPPKEPVYRSHHPGAIACIKKPAATMGIPHTEIDPKYFLKKGCAMIATMKESGSVGLTRRDASHAKPPVPRRDEKPVMGLVSQKNFITANAVDNILAVPKKPISKDVNYLKKQDYGKVPGYLNRVKDQIQSEYQMIEEMQRSNHEVPQDSVDILTDDERERLLQGLKANWEAVNREYQTLSFTLDTPAKKKRKEDYEAQLEQIENDIKKLSKRYVFLAQR
mmetsp:Transcript_66878/g.178793  ORF Transcript_66878/g.178793 Transcript_66878/m.178793 type:complete len:250 (-) Transcript_66878:200-949(-)